MIRTLVSGGLKMGYRIEPDDHEATLPVSAADDTLISPEKHYTVEELWYRLRIDHESFFTSVYPLFMHRDITKTDVRSLVILALEEARGNYRIVAQLFNLGPELGPYKRLLNFLRSYGLEPDHRKFRRTFDRPLASTTFFRPS